MFRRCGVNYSAAAPQLLNYLRATPFEVGVLLHFGPTAKFSRFIDFPKRVVVPIGVASPPSSDS